MTRDDYNMSSADDPMLEDGARENGKKYNDDAANRNKTIGQKVRRNFSSHVCLQ